MTAAHGIANGSICTILAIGMRQPWLWLLAATAAAQQKTKPVSDAEALVSLTGLFRRAPAKARRFLTSAPGPQDARERARRQRRVAEERGPLLPAHDNCGRADDNARSAALTHA